MIRFIKTSDLSLHVFQGHTIPSYAILSHRWEEDEITLQDVQGNLAPHKAGWLKLRNYCTFAARKGHDYAWIDTCCIDRSSSAELSESINSMFKWYRKANTCYAYLYDVPAHGDVTMAEWMKKFRGSEWFTRGWTLQELLAPRELAFVCRGWGEVLGTRASLSDEVNQVTGIPKTPLIRGWSMRDQFGASRYTIAQLMSWASDRHTTLVEDAAYSLMGLFSINMPLLYGEGANAFIRLQLEIMNKYDDNSLFAWSFPASSQALRSIQALNRSLDLPETFWWGSLLAPTIRMFKGCTGYFLHLEPYEDGRIFSMTNRGVQIEGLLRPYENSRQGGKRWLLPLNCGRHELWTQRLGLVLTGDRQRAMRVVNLQGFDYDLVDCELEVEKDKAAEYEYRKVYVPQAWPGDFD